MMSLFTLKMSLAASAYQPQLLQDLKSDGDDVIQTADGLCVKTRRSKSELESFLREKGVEGVTVETVDTKSDELSKDVLAFIGG